MDSGPGFIIFWLIILIGCSAYFSATETAFSSFNKIRLKNLYQDGNKKAGLVLRMGEQYDKVLSTILIGNNVVNILASSLATILFVQLFGNFGVTVSSAVMTILILIFGEISPKNLAKEAPEKFAMFSSPLLKVLMTVLTPINFLFTQWKKFLSKIFKTSADEGITEKELLTIVDEAQSGGGINEDEGELIRSAINFNELEAGDILTPRVDVLAADEESTKEELYEMFCTSGFSRIPIFKDTIDHIVGVVHQKDFFIQCYNKEKDVREVVKPVIFISESMEITKLIKLLQQSQSHMAVVTDEYGGTAGIVTLEDILEELVGEIWDEYDDVVCDIEKLTDNQYLVSGSADLEDLFEELEIKDERIHNTVNGWIMEMLEKMPEIDDTFVYRNLLVRVKELDGRRIKTAEIQVLPKEEEEEK